MNDGASVIVVGWTPDEFGEVALHRGVEEARLRAGRVVVVNATRGDALVDDRFADDEQLGRLTAELASSGVEVDVRRSMGADVGDQVLAVAQDVSADLVVIGLLISVPIVVFGSTLVLKLVERFPIIMYLGAGVLAYTAAHMIVSEPLLDELFDPNVAVRVATHALLIVGVLAAGWWATHRAASSHSGREPTAG